ncbi:uncharacterized protein LOC116953290 [Petromyzon marinus]|uniref:uncharacterized protein LOC116953290 n=1 Tax=Petromyzon marinus TaxID=7757 RepID=UPI003F6FDC0F
MDGGRGEEAEVVVGGMGGGVLADKARCGSGTEQSCATEQHIQRPLASRVCCTSQSARTQRRTGGRTCTSTAITRAVSAPQRAAMSGRLNLICAFVLVALLESAYGGVMRKRRDTFQHGLQMSSSSSSSSHSSPSRSSSSSAATSIFSSIMEGRRPQAKAAARDASASNHARRHQHRPRCRDHPHQGFYPQHQHRHQQQHQRHRCNHRTPQQTLHSWNRPSLNGRGPI